MKNLLLKISILLFCVQMPLTLMGQTAINATKLKGCDTLTVMFTYSTSLAVTAVQWNFGDGSDLSTEASPVHKYASHDEYDVTLTLNNTEITIEPAFIKIGATPDADFQSHDTLALGSLYKAFNPVKQKENLEYSYSWTLSDGATANTANFFHKFDTTGMYTAQLIISDTYGCADTAIKAVHVKKDLDVPTVFTPNGDNVNDLFIIEGNGENTNSIQIFTRTGVKVFEVAAKVIVWDGRMFSGEKVCDGIYYYVIVSDNNEKQTGFFYIYGSKK